MKSILKVTLLFLTAVLMFIGCATSPNDSLEIISTNEAYTIVTDGSQHYLRFPEELKTKLIRNSKHCQVATFPTYDTIADMRQGILEGDFSETEMMWILLASETNEQGDVGICNLNQLYNAVYPSNCEIDYITFEGDTYHFKINGGGYRSTLTYFLNKSDFDGAYESHHTERVNNATIVGYESIYGRGARIYQFDSGARYICYDLSTTETTLFVQEEYLTSSGMTIIDMYGSTNGAYFRVLIVGSNYGTICRPSAEWLQAFGLKPYVETETE